jgi:DNA adenine methylase
MNTHGVNLKIKIKIENTPIQIGMDKKDTDEIKFTIQKPFLKWAGGKTQIIYNVMEKFPEVIENYHEPFLGGGSVLLATLSKQKANLLKIKNKIFAYDLNSSLINTFNQIKINPQEVIYHTTEIVEEFSAIDSNTLGQKGPPKEINNNTCKLTREHYYYWIRNKYNDTPKNTSISAAYFIFLNKTGFKGMYREGKNGFNIPYGQKDRKSIPTIIDKKTISDISELIQNVEFICSDFTESIDSIKKGDFVYFDPPYVPVNENSFVGYTEGGFNLDMHKNLFNKIDVINSKNIKFLLSNANVELVNNHFKDYKKEEITTRRAIHVKNPEAKAKELLIFN